MNLRTPLIASLAVVSALGGVAAAAIALPGGSSPEPAAVVVAVRDADPGGPDGDDPPHGPRRPA
jgi:hypothetical protein